MKSIEYEHEWKTSLACILSHEHIHSLCSVAVDPKDIDRIHKRRVVVRMIRQINSISRNLLRCTNSVKVVQIDIVRMLVTFDTKDSRLAPRASTNVWALRAVVVEETVQANAVAEDVVRANDAQTPAGRSVDRWVWGWLEDRVWECFDVGEGDGGVWIRLIVGGLGLDLAHENVAGVDELVFVLDVVLDGSAISDKVSESEMKYFRNDLQPNASL
jgi:hypothetical protein